MSRPCMLLFHFTAVGRMYAIAAHYLITYETSCSTVCTLAQDNASSPLNYTWLLLHTGAGKIPHGPRGRLKAYVGAAQSAKKKSDAGATAALGHLSPPQSELHLYMWD